MKKQCQFKGCQETAKYALYEIKPNGNKEWLHVCILHEKHIGDENMRLAGGYFTKPVGCNG